MGTAFCGRIKYQQTYHPVIRTVEKELLEINKILQGLEGKIANSHESWHRSQAIQKQRDNKVMVYFMPV